MDIEDLIVGDISIFDYVRGKKGSTETALINDPLLSSQKMINSSYDALIQTSSQDLNCDKYIYELPIRESTKKKDATLPDVTTDRLQQQNNLLTSKLWYKLVKNKKSFVGTNNFVTISKNHENEKEILFSFFSKSPIYRNKQAGYADFVTTVAFRYPISEPDDKLEQMALEVVGGLENSALTNSATSLNSMFELAKTTNNFSVHYYYLPDGISQEGLKSATLLDRYDHNFGKHYNQKLGGPHPTVMPKLYETVYPAFVEGPHFHFTASFGSVYKLDESNSPHTYAVGYAIDIPSLLKHMKYVNSYSGPPDNFNDMGMPFRPLDTYYRRAKASQPLPPISDNALVNNFYSLKGKMEKNPSLTDVMRARAEGRRREGRQENSHDLQYPVLIEKTHDLLSAIEQGDTSRELFLATSLLHEFSGFKNSEHLICQMDKGLKNSSVKIIK